MVSLPGAADQRNSIALDQIDHDMRPRQVDLDRGSFALLAVDLDVAARLSDEAVDLAQSQPGTLAGLFCREERIESFLLNFLRHAPAGVTDDHLDILPDWNF